MRPDIITLDVMMPGMDGWAVLTQLHDEPPKVDIPVVMLTMRDDESLGYALGAAEYMVKPIDRERLLGAAAVAASRRPARCSWWTTTPRCARCSGDPGETGCGWKAGNGREGLRSPRNRPELVLLT
jgi:hypothetical protein